MFGFYLCCFLSSTEWTGYYRNVKDGTPHVTVDFSWIVCLLVFGVLPDGNTLIGLFICEGSTAREDMALSQVSRSVRLLLGQIQHCRPALLSNQTGKQVKLESLKLSICSHESWPDSNCHTARCLGQAASQPEPSADENEAVNPTFVNRNPRNLEQMALAVKDRGWKTTWPHREFYHRSVKV